MKQLFPLVLFLIFLFPCLRAQDLNLAEKQKLADEAFANRNYEEASKHYIFIYQNTSTLSEEKGKLAFKIGNTLQNLGQPKEALDWYNASADIMYELEKWDNYYITKSRVASVLDNEGDYAAAIEIAETVTRYFKEQKDSLYAGKMLHGLALYNYHDGNTDKAIQGFSDAIAWVGQLDDNLKSKSLNMIGNIWAVDLADERKALSYYKKSLALKLQSGTPESVSASYNNIGISYKNLGDYDSALVNYQLAYRYAQESKIRNTEINPLINIANLYKKQGKTKESIAEYEKVLELEKYMNVRQQADIRLNLGMAYNEWKEYQKALNQLRQAEALVKETDNVRDHATILSHIGIAYSGLKQFEEAYRAQMTYNNLKDSLFAKEREQEIADQMIKYEAAQKDLQLLEQQQELQAQELKSQKQLLIASLLVGIALLLAVILFYLFKRKAAIAKQASLELRLAEEKELGRLQAERLRISRELHDNIGSYLTLMSASIEQLSLQDEEEGTAPTRKMSVQNLQETISVSMRELRKTVWLLNKQSVAVDEIALRIRDFFKPIHQNGTHISVQAEGNTDYKINELQTNQLFRMIQEAVNNAYKHAQCTEIAIRLRVNEETSLDFSIADDGQGFEGASSELGNGLQNMKSRMAELNGSLHITSQLGKGTKVEGSFPLANTKLFV
ncbi:sensor histidine kinase [Cytophagales bacterium LB-30]|uniref:Sensor histidine kinase n=1 Tax=Shiella aurantiaca TaxID=3058365 RepID=A0ABT8F222_9BACT|nr:sensor histidine kinase [Shiella aurantiaca]MDN4164450.1 sensor histidine kinase [Shiella aurantiaca]